MERLGMPLSINPFGITFDAFSIERQLSYFSGESLPEDVFQHLEPLAALRLPRFAEPSGSVCL